jgi:hypothetical protein
MVVGIDRVDFLGPMTETQQAAMMLVIKERDEILEVLPEYVRVAPEHEHGGPLYLAYVEAVGALRQCNVSLPPRLRKGLVERPSLLQWRKPATSRRRDAYGGDEQAPPKRRWAGRNIGGGARLIPNEKAPASPAQ